MDLRDEVEFLREENRQLKERLGLTPTELFYVEARSRLQLSPSLARALSALMVVPLIKKAALLEAISLNWESRELKGVDVAICKLRKALATHGIEVETVWGVGFRMVPEMQARARLLLDQQQEAA
jgi:DNA-binding response OmpR family regulator